MSWATWQAATKAALDTFLANLNRPAADASVEYAQLWRDREEAAFAEFGGGGGGGDVTGPASSTDNALVRFDGTTGKIIQNSGATLSDGGTLSVSTVSASSLTASSSLTVSGATVTGFTASMIGDSTTVGRNVLTAATKADARSAIDAQEVSTTLTTLAGISLTSTDGHVITRAAGVWTAAQLAHTSLSALAWASSGHTASTGVGNRVATWSSGTPADVALGGANGVASLDASARVPVAQLGSGTPTSSTLLDGSGAWRALGNDDIPVHGLITAECGSAVDGDLNFDGSATVTVRGNAMAPSASAYTLACDLHADDLTIGNGVTIRLNGFVIRCHTLTIAASATVVISDDGTSAIGTSGAGDFSNTSTTDRDNGPGATGRNTPGIGASASNLSSPAIGGAGGAGGSAGSAGGSGGTVAWTTANQNATGWPFDPHSLISLRTITNVPWKCGAGGGAGAVGAAGGVSGGGGAGGGLSFVFAGAVTLGASASLTVAARGGDGGAASGLAAGGGGGGGGGCVIFRRRRQTLGSGATVTLTAAGGAGGAGSGTGNNGSAGSAGRTFDLIT